MDNSDNPTASSPFAGTIRFSTVSDHDHAGYLWITTILCILYSGLTIAARFRIKYGVYGSDDYLIGAAIVLQFVQGGVLLSGLARGLGQFNSFTTESDWEYSSRVYFGTVLLTVFDQTLIKSSVIGMMLRIFTKSNPTRRMLCFGFLGFTGLWGIASIITLAVDCNASTVLTTENMADCPNQYQRWEGIAAIDVVIELLIFILPATLTSSVQINAALRMQLIMAFAPRVALIALSMLHLHYIKGYPPNPEPQFAIVEALLIQQVTLFWWVVSATVPNLKTFINSFTMGFGVRIGPHSDGEGTRGSRPSHPSQGGESFALQTIGGSSYPGGFLGRGGTKQGTSHSRIEEREDYEAEQRDSACAQGKPMRIDSLRPDYVEHNAMVSQKSEVESEGSAGDGGSMVRTESQEMIIRKDVHWRVDSESRHGDI